MMSGPIAIDIITALHPDNLLGDVKATLNDGIIRSGSSAALEAVVHALEGDSELRTEQQRDGALWYVQVTVTRPVEDGWTATRTLPTFVIDGEIHGVADFEQAAQLATDIMCTDVHKDWQYAAVIRHGGTNVVTSHTL
jgi:hypothetical protein